MKFQIKPAPNNTYPIEAVLIKGDSVLGWLKEIQQMGFPLQGTQAFSLPNTTPHAIWGCLVVAPKGIDKSKLGRNACCQSIDGRLFIPENCQVFPKISEQEFNRLFATSSYLMHPALGLVPLKNVINWADFLAAPPQKNIEITKAKTGVSIVNQINSFQIVALSPEELLGDLEVQLNTKNESLKDKALTPLEKLKLKILKQFFENNKDTSKSSTENDKISSPSALTEKIQKWLSSTFKDSDKLMEHFQKDYEDLEKRNQKELDKLLNLFQKDPKEALKYAIPLGNETGRGIGQSMGNARFSFNKRWLNFSLFGSGNNRFSGNGTGILQDGIYDELHKQYMKTAQELIDKGDHYNAAFVYMKLLKNYHLAADTLKAGQLYSEAASVYLKYANNKVQAAECYEKGKMYSNAIEVYKELKNYEKVADLHMLINQPSLAYKYYHQVIEEYHEQSMFVKAALIYRYKLDSVEKAQESLLKGWRENKDAFNCLNNYFASIREEKTWQNQIEQVYQEEINNTNLETFLQVLKYEYKQADKSAKPTTFIKDIAYEIISKRAQQNHKILSELKAFNKEDKILRKDILRYKQKKG